MIVYKTTNLINSMSYIGKDSKNKLDYLGSGIYLNRAIKKYGKNNFQKETVAWCDTKDKLDFLEKFFIGFFKTRAPNGYNLTDGGDGLLNPSEDVRKRIGLANAKRAGSKHPLFGKHHTEETKRKMRESHKGFVPSWKGKPQAEEQLRKLSEIRKGRIPWNRGLKGILVAWNKGLTKETDERVKKYGESRRGKHNKPHLKKHFEARV